ncbi:MAG: tRNA A22 N-methylase [Myxococcota bacterium]
MKRAGRPRRQALAGLVRPDDGVIIDVGADHGHVAAAVGAIATERMPGRRGRTDVPWVIADGLAPFRRVDTAIIAGMGARAILRILDRGPRPERAAIVHAQDDPIRLRCGLAACGWRIEAESLAWEAGRYAEIIRVEPGIEAATGCALELGPRLVRGDSPDLEAHLRHLRTYFAHIAERTQGRAPAKHSRCSARVAYIDSILSQRFRAS